MSEPSTTTDLVIIEPEPRGLLPIGDAGAVLTAYQALQKTIDASMKDCMVKIGGKNYRTKNYWRAVAVMYSLTVEVRSEERVEIDGDWGYLVTSRATAPNGRFMDGDGAVFASEKKGRDVTVHNVRAHAITRAKNRAIADLCGFGEVSAEEVQRDEQPRPRKSAPKQSANGTASNEQLIELVQASDARAMELGYEGDADCAKSIRDAAVTVLGLKIGERPPASSVYGIAAAIRRIQVDEGGGALAPDGGAF